MQQRIQALTDELTNDPVGIGYGTLLAEWDSAETPENREGNTAIAKAIIAAMRAHEASRLKRRFIDERTLVAELGPTVAESIMTKLEAAAESNSLIARAVRWLQEIAGETPGLNIGDVVTQGVINGLVGEGVLTADEGAAVKSLGQETVSRDVMIGVSNPKVIEMHYAIRKRV